MSDYFPGNGRRNECMELYSVDDLIRNIRKVPLACPDFRRELKLGFKYFNNEYGNIRSFIEIKIGEGRWHWVKSMKAFLKAVGQEQVLEFGRSFTYNPSLHTFRKEDLEILEFLKDINDADDDHSYKFSNYGGSSTLIAGRRAALPDRLLIRFLKLLKGRPIDIVIKNEEYGAVDILEKDMPLNFKLCFYDKGIKLSHLGETPIQLDSDFKVFFLKNSIYLPTLDQLKIYKSLYNLMSKNSEVVFDINDKEKVENSLLPVLKKIAEKIEIQGMK